MVDSEAGRSDAEDSESRASDTAPAGRPSRRTRHTMPKKRSGMNWPITAGDVERMAGIDDKTNAKAQMSAELARQVREAQSAITSSSDARQAAARGRHSD